MAYLSFRCFIPIILIGTLIGILLYFHPYYQDTHYGNAINPKGALNPDYTMLVCITGTGGIRPPASYTTKLKISQMKERGYKDTDPSHYEEDHWIPLSIGGDPKSPDNLWPEPIEEAVKKDRVEFYLYHKVCSGKMKIEEAQRKISDWPRLYEAIKKNVGVRIKDEDDLQ